MPFTKQHSAYAWVVTCILFLINLTFHNLPLHSSYKIHQPFTDYFLRLPYSELLEKRLFRSRANRRLVLTSTRASHHSCVQFLISDSTRWLRTHRFSEPTFWPWATKHWKNAVFRNCSTFSRTWSSLFRFFLLSDSSIALLTTAAASAHLGSLTSKLPSINRYDMIFELFDIYDVWYIDTRYII